MAVLDDVPPSDVARLAATAERVGAQLDLVDAAELALPARGRNAEFESHISVAAYLRLFADEVLPVNAARVVYIDSDVLVRHDLASLARLDLGGAAVAAARDQLIPRRNHPLSYTVRRDDRPYFNSGVLVIDLGRMRSGLGHELRTYIQKRPRIGWFDQDAFNDVLAPDDWLKLDPRWNVQSGLLTLHLQDPDPWVDEMRRMREGLLTDPLAVHFSGRPKPWEAQSRHPFRHEWRAALRSSGWLTSTRFAVEEARLHGRSLVHSALVRAGRRSYLERISG